MWGLFDGTDWLEANGMLVVYPGQVPALIHARRLGDPWRAERFPDIDRYNRELAAQEKSEKIVRLDSAHNTPA